MIIVENQDKKLTGLGQLTAYRLANEVADKVWSVVLKWDWFAKDTLGKQWVRAADSISANIAEGYGRYFFRENITFLYYARGSVQETQDWLGKARRRNLITESDYEKINSVLQKLPKEINIMIKINKSNLEKTKKSQNEEV
jgi:four helix bundle protein